MLNPLTLLHSKTRSCYFPYNTTACLLSAGLPFVRHTHTHKRGEGAFTTY